MQQDLLNHHSDNAQNHSLMLEALLFGSEISLTQSKIMQLLNWDEQSFDRAVTDLQGKLENSAVELISSASGYRLQIRQQFSTLVHTLYPEKQQKLSQALLETLTIVAYKQPVTRADIEQIRGVSTSSAILRQLFDKGWIMEKGFRELPGKPSLLHTTKAFLDAFGLQSLKQLPELPELKEISELE